MSNLKNRFAEEGAFDETLQRAFEQAPEDPDGVCDHVIRSLGSSDDDVAVLAVRLGSAS